jgi:hypothetical protein
MVLDIASVVKRREENKASQTVESVHVETVELLSELKLDLYPNCKHELCPH